MSFPEYSTEIGTASKIGAFVRAADCEVLTKLSVAYQKVGYGSPFEPGLYGAMVIHMKSGCPICTTALVAQRMSQ